MTDADIYRLLPERLLPWFSGNSRDLPWRRDREPYHIWISEIMLQQTRVEAVKPYYERFLAELPDIPSLAKAPEEQVFKLWEGLGYYSRARNLQKAAQFILAQFGGIFPDTMHEILTLPGIGPYSAGAIASICYDLPEPAVDGNVMRVISRLLCLDEPPDKPSVRKTVADSLRRVYPVGNCGAFTQSLMELGAIVCVPNGAPSCTECPLSDVCKAYHENETVHYPVRSEKKTRRQEDMTVFLIHDADGRTAVSQRPDHGLLAGLWELPHTEGILNEQDALDAVQNLGLIPVSLLRCMNRSHVFTHIIWNMRCYELVCKSPEHFVFASPEELETRYPLPTAFRQFLNI